ncbi:hypothetical protein HETIRDRAFT_311607 [Heterobasidion irregulare TC 32-1]|uniref:Uncharacterized protein n=1 Tax=Heterobasidion irregulare (strain TC 32-1) TaxID=747525 RepID=W4KJF8_HETIT|nr:uncharacterized protein HETIRDRAFT_311607 [Heterobasidion irregulare TC 32-1]ETW85201.1 hypothetical protein HETIRDRAFT_311607 [Heterobasidion irregulare TC 32-1]
MSFQLGNSDPIEIGVITIVELGELVVGILHKLTCALQVKHADEHAPVLGSKEGIQEALGEYQTVLDKY